MRSIFFESLRPRCHRSTSRWRLSHNVGPLPHSLPSRSAISTVTGCFSLRMLCSVTRLTPKSLAIAFLFFPSTGKISSRNNTPGCMGTRPGSRRARDSVIFDSLLVILLVVNPVGVAPLKLERDAPWAVDVQRIAPVIEAMEIEAWNVQVLRRLSHIQRLQSPHDPLYHPAVDPPRSACLP